MGACVRETTLMPATYLRDKKDMTRVDETKNKKRRGTVASKKKKKTEDTLVGLCKRGLKQYSWNMTTLYTCAMLIIICFVKNVSDKNNNMGNWYHF